MERTVLLSIVAVVFLAACQPGVAAPEATGSARPEEVAKSLASVNPEDSLHLFEYDRQAPLDIQEKERWHEDHATWLDFTYASPKGGRVEARLVIPDGKGPFPGIILQHGGTGSLADMEYQARAFSRHGAVTMMITDPYRRPGGWEITQYMGNTWPIFNARDLEIKIQLIIDLQRAVDILSARPEVDPDRLAYYGVSFGGAMGGLFAGVEDRLVAYVLVVGDGGLVEHTSDPGEDGINVHFSENWAALMWPTESLHFVGRAAPAALLFQNGIHDTYVPPQDAIRYQTAGSEPKTVIWYDAGHDLGWGHVFDAAKWLQSYLGDRLIFLSPNYRSNAVIIDRFLLVIVLAGLGIYLVDVYRRKALSWGEHLGWLLVILLSGPVGLGIYWFIARSRVSIEDFDAKPATLKVVLATTILCTTGLVLGLFLGDLVNSVMASADFRIRLFQLYLAILVAGWLFGYFNRKTYQMGVVSHILVVNTFWVSMMLVPRLLGDFMYIPQWLQYPTDVLIGSIITFPLHFWLLKRGLTHGLPGEKSQVTVPLRKRLHWLWIMVLLLVSYFAVLGSVLLMLQRVTGYGWQDVIYILIGVYL